MLILLSNISFIKRYTFIVFHIIGLQQNLVNRFVLIDLVDARTFRRLPWRAWLLLVLRTLLALHLLLFGLSILFIDQRGGDWYSLDSLVDMRQIFGGASIIIVFESLKQVLVDVRAVVHVEVV